MLKKEMPLTSVWEVRTSLPTEESAVAISRALVESRLAACVQISNPIRSIYRWNSAIQDEQEFKLSVKTTEFALDLCMEKIGLLHPYEVPEIMADPISRISDSYHRWLVGEIQPIESIPNPSDPNLGAGQHVDSALDPWEKEDGAWHLQIQLIKNEALVQKSPLASGVELGALPISFEAVAEKISNWPGMYFEMDGSFVWVSSEKSDPNQTQWQLDGMVYDRNGQVQYIELKGRCDRTSWDKLIEAIFSDAQQDVELLRKQLGVHLVQRSIWISESDFKKSFL